MVKTGFGKGIGSLGRAPSSVSPIFKQKDGVTTCSYSYLKFVIPWVELCGNGILSRAEYAIT